MRGEGLGIAPDGRLADSCFYVFGVFLCVFFFIIVFMSLVRLFFGTLRAKRGEKVPKWGSFGTNFGDFLGV